MRNLLSYFQGYDVLVLVGFALAMVGAGLVVWRMRGYHREEESDLGEMTNFRELHAQGVLSDEEYRTIKSKLSARLRSEIKDANRTP